MTVIAWDGKTLAADRQCTRGNLIGNVTKIERVGASIVANAGDFVYGNMLMHWFRQGAVFDDWPKPMDDETHGALLAVTPGGILHYCGVPVPAVFRDLSQHFADGSGRDIAHGAMAAGADARRAVQIACDLDAFCGGGVDAFELL